MARARQAPRVGMVDKAPRKKAYNVMKPQRKRLAPGKCAAKDITRCRLQNDLFCRRGPFKRFIRGVIQSMPTKPVKTGANSSDEFRVKPAAVLAVQSATEDMLTRCFEDANLFMLHAGRKGVSGIDLELVRRTRGWTPKME